MSLFHHRANGRVVFLHALSQLLALIELNHLVRALNAKALDRLAIGVHPNFAQVFGTLQK